MGDPPPEKGARPRNRKPPRRRWLRRLCYLLLALGVLLPLANGPLFRLAAHKILAGKIADAGLRGGFRFAGSAIGGITLSGVDLAGEGSLRELAIERAEIRYDLFGLLGKDKLAAIGPIAVRGIDAVVAGREPGRDPEEARARVVETLGTAGDAWESIAGALRVEVAVDDANLRVVDGSGTPKFQIDGLDLRLAGGEGGATLQNLQIDGAAPFAGLELQVAVRPDNTIEVGGLAIEDGVTLERLALAPPGSGGGLPSARGELSFFGGELELVPVSTERLTLTLEHGEVDLGRLARRIGQPGRFGGRVSELEAAVAGKSVASIEISGRVAGSSLSYWKLSDVAARSGFRFADRRLKLIDATVSSGRNRLTGSGEVDFSPAAPAPPALQLDLGVDAPEIGAVLRQLDVPLAGRLTGDVAFGIRGGEWSEVAADLRGSELRYGDLAVRELVLRSVPQGALSQVSFSGDVDGSNRFEGDGGFDFQTLEYEARANAHLAAIADLAPWLRQFGIGTAVAGAAEIDWRGGGALEPVRHTGRADIASPGIRFAAAETISGNLTLAYSPGSVTASECRLTAGDFSATGNVTLAGGRLDVDGAELSGSAPGAPRYAAIDASAPFEGRALRSADAFLAQPGPIELSLRSEGLQIARLLELAGWGGWDGRLDADLQLGGTLSHPAGDGTVAVRGFAGSGEPSALPLDADLRLEIGDGRIELDGEVRGEGLPAVTVTGGTPVRPRAIASDPEALGSQGFDLKARLPETDLGRLIQWVPQVSSAEGTLAAQLDLTGSWDSPRLSGRVVVGASRVRFESAGLPSLTDLDIDLRLTGDRAEFESGRLTLAGGEIVIGGGATFPSLADPDLELRLSAREALLYRDENMSLRANAQLALDGRLSAARLSGRLGVVHSQLVREIEILPIGLPTLRRAPAAPRAPALGTRKHIGVDTPPFSNWELDVRLVTDDPFLVRSNLARAAVSADLALGGTGARPLPSGRIWLQDGAAATLPFSTLEVREGVLEFDEGTGFDPRVRFAGVSEVRSNTITLRVYDQLSDPRTLITSDPPMPEEDAVALLATGRKASELGDTEVIAGTAATLLFDKVKRRLFKEADARERPFAETVEVDAGGVDPKTGRRSASAKVKLSDRVFLLGGIDVGGEYRGLVKILIRVK